MVTTRTRRTTAAAAVVAAGAALHAAPAVLTLRPPRMRWAPALAGMGRPDHIALTFDDGPDPEGTPAIMEQLDRLRWQATFFLLGSMVRAYPSIAADLVAAGHEVAVHGDSHRSHLWLTLPQAMADVRRGRDVVADAAGVDPRWFRPPYGTLSGPALAAGRAAGLRTVLWTAWGRDWRARATPSGIADTVMAQLTPGGTILLHDSDCTSAPGSWKTTLGALPILAERLAGHGLSVGPLSHHGIDPGIMASTPGATDQEPGRAPPAGPERTGRR